MGDFVGSDVVAYFDEAEIAEIRVGVINSATGTNPTTGSSIQFVACHDVEETGIIPIPEPSSSLSPPA